MSRDAVDHRARITPAKLHVSSRIGKCAVQNAEFTASFIRSCKCHKLRANYPAPPGGIFGTWPRIIAQNIQSLFTAVQNVAARHSIWSDGVTTRHHTNHDEHNTQLMLPSYSLCCPRVASLSEAWDHVVPKRTPMCKWHNSQYSHSLFTYRQSAQKKKANIIGNLRLAHK